MFGVARLDRSVVGLFAEHEAAGTNRSDQVRGGGGQLGHVGEHRATVHEVEIGGRNRTVSDVVRDHRSVRPGEVVEKAGVHVGGDDVTLRSDPSGQRPGDRSRSRSDLEAPPARRDANSVESAKRGLVVDRLELLEARPLGVVRDTRHRIAGLFGGHAGDATRNRETAAERPYASPTLPRECRLPQNIATDSTTSSAATQ